MQAAIADETVRIVRVFKETGVVPNVVNLAVRTRATHLLTVRHRDRVGVLAHVLGALRAAGINVQEMENAVFEGGEAAIARIQINQSPSEDVLDTVRENEHVLATEVIDLK